MSFSKFNKYLLTFCLLLAAAFLILFTAVSWEGRFSLCHPDMYCDQLVARLIWEKKSIFPEGWSFGNQYNVISTPVVMALFYGLTNDMNLSMVLGCTFMNLLIVIAFWWALRPFFSEMPLALGLVTLLGCIISKPAAVMLDGQFLYVMANYYACYLIVIFIVWGDWLRLLSLKRKSVFSVSFVISLLASFLIGMQSIRQFLMMILPMAAVEVLRFIVHLSQKNRNKYVWAPTAACLLYSAANLLGYFFVKSLHLPGFSIYGSLGMRPVSQWISMIEPAVKNIMRVNGLFDLIRNGMQPLSVLLWILTVVLIGWALVRAFIHLVRKHAPDPEDILVLLSAASVAGVFCVNIVIDMEVRPLYYFTWIPLAAFSAISVYRCLKGKSQAILAILLTVLLLNNLFYSYGSSYQLAQQRDPDRQQIAQWIIDHDYQYLYGNWQEVNAIAPYGNGEFIAAAWSPEPFQTLTYTNVNNVYTEDHNRQAVYLVTEDELPKAEEILQQQHQTWTFRCSFADGHYRLYTSPHQLMQ